jgi:hypothetical protein
MFDMAASALSKVHATTEVFSSASAAGLLADAERTNSIYSVELVLGYEWGP